MVLVDNPAAQADDGLQAEADHMPFRRDTAAAQWIHRQALQVIGILPDDHAQATAVLDRARFLLGCWQFTDEAVEPDTVTALRVVKPKAG